MTEETDGGRVDRPVGRDTCATCGLPFFAGEVRFNDGVGRQRHNDLLCVKRLRAENERLRKALQSAIATLERDDDEWGICGQLRAALTPNA